MLTSIEAEIDVAGNVRLLEPVEITKTTRAIVTLLDESNGRQSTVERSRAFFQTPEFINRKSYSSEEIEEQIKEARDSWE